MKDNKHNILPSQAGEKKIDNRELILEQFKKSPIPDAEILNNLGLYFVPTMMKKLLLINEVYQKIVNVPGIVCEFGTRWGQNLNLFQTLRSIYEPYNYTRKIVGFDTFEGFPNIHEKDAGLTSVGAFSVTKGYENYLENLLKLQENESSPLNHIKNFELVKGDASITINDYLKDHQETIISLAYFDFDIYEPTKKCLEAIMPRLTKGSVLVFDELNLPAFPGETLAVMEVLGLNNHRFIKSSYSAYQSYIIIE
jgi:hypothetical protein